MKIRMSHVLVSTLIILVASGCAGLRRTGRRDLYTYSWMFSNFSAVRKLDSDFDEHPEYYLEKLTQAGVLRRGLTKEEVESWLGKPNQWTGKQDVWLYGMGYSGMYITFTNGLASEYHWWFEDGPLKNRTW